MMLRVQTMLRCKASEVAAAAVAQRVTLGLPVTIKQVERVLRALGVAKDWPAISKIARDLKVWTQPLIKVNSVYSGHSRVVGAVLMISKVFRDHECPRFIDNGRVGLCPKPWSRGIVFT